MQLDELVQNVLQLRREVVEVKCQFVIHKVTSEWDNLRDRMGVVQIVVADQRIDLIFPVLIESVNRFDQLGFIHVRVRVGRHLNERVVQWKRRCGSGGHFIFTRTIFKLRLELPQIDRTSIEGLGPGSEAKQTNVEAVVEEQDFTIGEFRVQKMHGAVGTGEAHLLGGIWK